MHTFKTGHALSTLLIMSMVLASCSRDESNQAQPQLSEPDSTSAEATTPEPDTAMEHELSGTSWKLVKIQSMNDTEALPAGDTAYTITFNADGSANMQVDCNRGSANWDSPSKSQLTFGPMALTRAMCPPGSIHDQFVREIPYVRSYVLEDGHLHLATMADGSIIEFEPFEE